MKQLLLILACSSVLFGQSFPTTIYTPLVAKDNLQTTLSVAMLAGDAVAVVASTTGWAVNMAAYICDTTTIAGGIARCTGTYEVMLVTAVATNILTVTRGYGGTSAIAHASGKAVVNAPTAVYNTVLSNELLATQKAVGANTVFSSTAYASSGTTSGIQEAINAAAANGGGHVQLPAGTVTSSTITLPNGTPIWLSGAGEGVTTLKLTTSTNADLITNANFATLSGSNTAPAGVYRLTLSDMTIDGNRANQSGTSWCFRIYGHGYTLRDIAVQNCLTGGLYSEYALDSLFTTYLDDLETFWSNIRVSFTGGDNIDFRGPHDSYMDHITSYQAGGRCFRASGDNLTYNGNTHLTDFDGYICSRAGTVPACEINKVAVQGSGVTCSSDVAGSHGLAVYDTNQVNLVNGNFATGGGANASGLYLGGSTGVSFSTFSGVAGGSAASGSYAVTIDLAQNNTLDFLMNCGAAGCINHTGNEQGGTVIRGNVLGSGPLLVGTAFPATTSVQMSTLSAPTSGPKNFTQQVNVPAWHKYHVVKIANGAGGCVTANGCWSVNGGTAIAATAGLVQSIALDNLPASTMVSLGRMQTAVAFTGTATATANLGTGSSVDLFYSGNYNLKTAVAATNLVDVRPTTNTDTNMASVLELTITTTVNNVDQIVTASAIDVWVQFGVLQ